MNRGALARSIAGLAGSACVVVIDHAQPIESLALSVNWMKPSIKFGESNTASFYATVGPEIGSTVAWNTTPGQGEPATLMAFATTVMGLTNLQHGELGTLSWTLNTEFALQSSIPKLDGKGGFFGLSLGQIGPPPNPMPNTQQTVWLFDLVWTANIGPEPKAPYEVQYSTLMSSAKVFLDVGFAWVGENAAKINSQGGFTVIPATPTIAFGMFAVLSGAWRRRRMP